MTTKRRKTTSGPPAGGACPVCGRKHRSLTPEQCRDRRRTERSLSASVTRLAKRAGWTVARVGRGWVGGEGGQFRTPTNRGWPDLMLFRPEGSKKLLAMELKRELGVVATDQWAWLNLMNECGISAIVVRPSDVREGRIAAILGAK